MTANELLLELQHVDPAAPIFISVLNDDGTHTWFDVKGVDKSVQSEDEHPCLLFAGDVVMNA